MGASVGAIGTARAQYHLRQMFVFLNVFALNQPEVMISHAADRFKPGVASRMSRRGDIIRLLLHHLVEWTNRITNR
jgi:chromate reductase